MHLDEKLQMAERLDRMGVDVIEAGFPIASQGDFESVNQVAKLVQNAAVAGLCRAKRADIEASAEALAPAKRRRIHTFISTSPLHMKHKLQMPPEAVLDAIAESVSTARNFTDDVEWSAEDATRTEHDFLCNAAIFEMLINRVPNIDKAILSVHCHNDLGLAVSNSLAGIRAGARQVECTINGIGERAGNAAMEEVVMAMRTRPDVYPYETGIDTTQITKASRTLSRITGFSVQPNKAIVGANAFAHESGIHQDGMLKNAQTYEIMTPESVGLFKSEIVLGKHSGRHALKKKVEELGYELGDNAFQDLFKRFKDLADKKKTVFDEDIIALVGDDRELNERIKFVSLMVKAGSDGQSALLKLEIDGEEKETESAGNGPVDAIFNAIGELFPHEADLPLYQVHAVTGGTDAQAEVTVKLEENGNTGLGQSADVDTMVASARAYVYALNKLLRKREKTAKVVGP